MASSIICFKNYGSGMASRLLSRQIFSENEERIKNSDSLILDFENINMITLSFATEFFDSLKRIGKNKNLQVLNLSGLSKDVVHFAMNNTKELVY